MTFWKRKTTKPLKWLPEYEKRTNSEMLSKNFKAVKLFLLGVGGACL